MRLRKALRKSLFVAVAVATSVFNYPSTVGAADPVDFRSAVTTAAPHVLTVHFETPVSNPGPGVLENFSPSYRLRFGDQRVAGELVAPAEVPVPALPVAPRAMERPLAFLSAGDAFRITPPIADPNRRAGVVVATDLVITQDLPSDAEGFEVELADGTMVAANIVCRDRVSGLVAMRVETEFDEVISQADEASQIGQSLAVVTRDRHGNPQVRQAIASTDTNWPTRQGFIQQLDGRLDDLHVGSPVIDVTGSLVGVLVKNPPDAGITSRFAGAGPTLSCLPLANVQRLIQLAGSESPADLVRGMLGIQLGGKANAFVRSLQANSTAAEAGMQKMDVVKRVGDYDVRSTEQVVAAAASYRAGDSVAVTVKRDDALIEFNIVLAGIDEDAIGATESPANSSESRVFNRAFVLKDGKLVPIDVGKDGPSDFAPTNSGVFRLNTVPPGMNGVLPGAPALGRLPAINLDGMVIERSEMEDNVRKLEKQLRSNSQQLDSISEKLQLLLDK